uniref:Uncharacterized protein n=1 Tax=Manihot esculenta TaxID=3983 RepID=A0A2C9UE51_MANES
MVIVYLKFPYLILSGFLGNHSEIYLFLVVLGLLRYFLELLFLNGVK